MTLSSGFFLFWEGDVLEPYNAYRIKFYSIYQSLIYPDAKFRVVERSDRQVFPEDTLSFFVKLHTLIFFSGLPSLIEDVIQLRV